MVGRQPLDWSKGLPPELLQAIARKLPDISDFIRFRAVCTAWRSSAPVSDPPPTQLPWFLFLHDQDKYNPLQLEGDLRFYSPFSGRFHTIPSPSSSGNILYGTGHDYLLTFDPTTRQISLLNPLFGAKVPLPFLDILTPHPVRLGPDPIQSGGLGEGESVVLWGKAPDETSALAFYRPLHKEWVVIENGSDLEFSFPGAYYNGMYFVNEYGNGTTRIIDAATGKVLHVVPPPVDWNKGCFDKTYLVQSAGDILRVCLCDSAFNRVTDCRFHISRLEDLTSENGGKPRWVSISGIGDQMLFLDGHNSFSLSCRDFSGFRGNSIYFLKWYVEEINHLWVTFLGRYDIEQARTEHLIGPSRNGGTWIVPSLR